MCGVAAQDGTFTVSQGLLLVEDCASMRDIIGQILGDQFGSIHWVGHGNEVLAKAAQLVPKTILLDISLPGISGLILLPLLSAAHPHTGIVMLTNHTHDLYRRQAFARGADAYVLKRRANKDLLPAIWASREGGVGNAACAASGE